MDRGATAERIRGARARHGKAGRGNPYPDWMRREAVEYARARVDDGASAAQISRELGLPSLTLARWSKEPRGRFLPVVVEPAAGAAVSASLVVHGPCGVRIEGLDLAALAALLRALS